MAVAVHRPSNGAGGGESSLSERQRQLLADRLFEAAVSCADKAHTPPTPSKEGEFVAMSAKHYAQAALALTQAYMTASQPRGAKK